MRKRYLTVLTALLLTAGCHPPLETKEHHIVHRGESARLTASVDGAVYVAAVKGATNEVVTAVNRKDAAGLEALEKSGQAFRVDSGTEVRVTGESFNERRIEVTDGPQKGRQGWVPFEWLSPR